MKIEYKKLLKDCDAIQLRYQKIVQKNLQYYTNQI